MTIFRRDGALWDVWDIGRSEVLNLGFLPTQEEGCLNLRLVENGHVCLDFRQFPGLPFFKMKVLSAI